MLFVTGVLIAAYIAGLFVDVTRDASKYAAIAREIVRTYRAKLDELANRLIEKETVDAGEFAAMFA